MSRPLLSRVAERLLFGLLRGRGGAALEWLAVVIIRRWPWRLRGTAALINAVSRRPNDLVAGLDFGGLMAVPPIPDGAAYFVLGHHGERETVALLKSMLQPGDVFVDIGANLGYYTLLAARLIGPSGRVVAFEAQPRLIPYLCRSCELNGFGDRVTVIHAAVGARHGETSTLFFAANPEVTGTPSLLQHGWLRGGASVDVPAVKLDTALAEAGVANVDVIKIDVEGGELAALEGMTETLRRGVRLVVCELLPTSLAFASIEGGTSLEADPTMAEPTALADALGLLGYVPHRITRVGSIGARLSNADLEEITWGTNVAFVQAAAGTST